MIIYGIFANGKLESVTNNPNKVFNNRTNGLDCSQRYDATINTYTWIQYGRPYEMRPILPNYFIAEVSYWEL